MIVRCEDIRKYFKAGPSIVKALDGVSLEIEKNDVFGIVGGSGCGKTTLGKIILGIMKPDSGILRRKTDNLQVVFQDPYNSLDPKMKVSGILSEGLVLKGQGARVKGQIEKIIDLIKLPKTALDKYPHQFSGGERQRIAIGRAILTNPVFMVCDEPVSNLDVTIQLGILKLLKEIKEVFSITYLLISHDLKVIRYMCNKMAVMQNGRIIESGKTDSIFANPGKEYTRALLSSAFYDTIKNDGKTSI